MSTPQQPVALKSNVIGLLGATTLGVVFLSPAMTLYGLFGPIFLECGKAAPLSFVLALGSVRKRNYPERTTDCRFNSERRYEIY